jgi:uncharacterized protein with ATP-grasp and redox domains
MNDQIPPPLMTSEPGSYARYTITERKPQIIENAIADNGYPPHIVAALHAFRDEIAHHPIQPLTGIAPDVAFWHRAAAPYRHRTWLQLPWYFAETYFYRRLLEVVRYFQPGKRHLHDPFGAQKRDQERQAAAWLDENWDQIADADPEQGFVLLLHSGLWGNRADLSNLTMREEVCAGASTAGEQHNLLIDHTSQVAALLSAGVVRVDFVGDNTGHELLFDLALASFLLDQGWAQQVVLHLKDHPFFVSDAMPQDARALLALLRDGRLGRRLGAQLAAGRLVLKDNPFWTTCLMFRTMPASLAAELGGSDLVILKGDVNYRRLLSDAHWPHTARLETIAAYFPAPFVSVRTLKGEILVGLEPGQAEELAAQDPDWLVNGQRGLIHYVPKA